MRISLETLSKVDKNESVYLSCHCRRSDPDKNGNDDVNLPRGRITGSRAKIKNQNKHGETKYASIFNRLFGVKLALFNLLLVSHRRRTILMRDIAFSRTSYRRFGSNTRLARAKRFWIRPGRTSAWWGNFVSQTVVPEEWKENFRMSRPSLLKLSEELRPYIERKSTSSGRLRHGSSVRN